MEHLRYDRLFENLFYKMKLLMRIYLMLHKKMHGLFELKNWTFMMININFYKL